VRANNDCALTERIRNKDSWLERRIEFNVGYDHREFPEECGGGGHGQSGMDMRWVLSGPLGAVQWVVHMVNWVPGNVRSIKGVEERLPVSLVPCMQHGLGDLYATDLGYHSPIELYEGQYHTEPGKCEYLPGQDCYYDGSGLNAEPLLEAFLNHGPMAVWAALARYYNDVLSERNNS